MVRWLITALALAPLAGQPAAAQSESSSLRVREAASALVRGNVDQAITLYNEALEDKTLPNDRRATILNDRGVALARRQQHKDAIEDFNRAIQLYPEYAAVYNNRGSLLLGLGVVREAVKDFDRAIVLAPGYAAAYSNRAGAYIKLGQVDRAIADYSRSIALTPNSPAALSGRGRAHLAAQRPHGAIRDFTRAVSLDARFGAAYRSRAEAKVAIDRYEEAIEDYSRAIAFEPQQRRDLRTARPRLHGGRQRRLRRQGLRQGHRAELRHRRLLRRARPRLRQGRGVTRTRSTISRAPSSSSRVPPKAFAYRAWAYRQHQQLELGVKDVERALKLDANSAETYWARGEISDSARAHRGGGGRPAGRRFRSILASGLRPRPSSGSASRRAPTSPRWSRPPWSAGASIARAAQFIATNEEFPRLKINLEMMGKGQPRILEWDVKKPPFQGIAVLRFHAGTVDGQNGPEEVEHAAVIDLQTNAVVAVEVQRQGSKVAQWSWDDGKLVVAAADGITDEFQLRQGKAAAAATCGCAAKETGTLRRAQAQDAVRSPVRLQLGSLGSRHQSAPWAFTHLPFLLEALSVRQRSAVYR